MPEIIGSITTSPAGAAAPALGMLMLVLLALALSVGAVSVLRRKAASATARLAVVAAVTILAGIAYAGTFSVVMVSGDQCAMRTTQTWNSARRTMLENQCSHALRIEDLDAGCPNPEVPMMTPCVAGQTLAGGAACHLLACLAG